MSTNAFFILAGAAFIFGVVALIFLVIIHSRLKRLLSGKNGADLEETITTLEKNIRSIEENEKLLAEGLDVIDRRLQTSVRAVEMTRFNPFEDQGGNHSFAISLVNEKGDGVVLSSLYSRERMSVFAKKVESGKSDIELSKEEKDVLDRGIKSVAS